MSDTHFDILKVFQDYLKDEQISGPLAAILSLSDLIEHSNAGTMFELVGELNNGAKRLKNQTPNAISLTAGCELFIAFVTLFPHASDNFSDLRTEIVKQGRNYANEALTYRDKIANLALGFIKDDSVILTHSHSRVVIKTLLRAHKHNKRISVYVTEARPTGRGLQTYRTLTDAGVPCTVVLDSAVSYVMDKVDFVLVGSEAVVESGGLVNAIGSNQIAIIAKAANRPFYALAESYKFHRLFPLTPYDLPTHNADLLKFPDKADKSDLDGSAVAFEMSDAQIALNPSVDYTRPDLISLVFSDLGTITPEGVSQYLVGMFAG